MLKIEQNNFSQWEILLKVLSEEIPENDPVFQDWLNENKENRKLYLGLKGKRRNNDVSFDKDKVFNNISDILDLNIRKKVPFYGRKWFTYVASVLVIMSVSISSYFIFTNGDTPEPIEYASSKKSIFEPGSKKAYLLSSKGETIDLSESFELKNEDGTIISNKSEGIVHFQQTESAKKKVELHTIYVPKGGEYELLLADGSKVYLNSESKLIFPNHFEEGTRQVELIGEAYFEVKKDHHPFIVKTADMQIEVLGTSFNVNAYPENASANATLVEGSVKVHIPENPETYMLVPENNFTIQKSTHEISIRKVNTEIYTAWVKGEFMFRNQPLGEILAQLVRWYDFKIEYENPAIKTMRFTGSAEKARSLDYLLNQIQSVTDIKYKNEGDKIILY